MATVVNRQRFVTRPIRHNAAASRGQLGNKRCRRISRQAPTSKAKSYDVHSGSAVSYHANGENRFSHIGVNKANGPRQALFSGRKAVTVYLCVFIRVQANTEHFPADCRRSTGVVRRCRVQGGAETRPLVIASLYVCP